MKFAVCFLILSASLCTTARAQMIRYEAKGPVMPLDEVGVIFAEKEGKIVADLIFPEHALPKGYTAQGIAKDDRLVMINGKDVHTIKEMEDSYAEVKIGETIKIGLLRGEEKMIVTFAKANPEDLPKRKMIRKTDGKRANAMSRVIPTISRAIIYTFLAFQICGSLSAQSGMFNQRDDKYRLLGLKRTKEIYESERSKFDRIRQLYEKQMASSVDLENARQAFADAEVNYQQSLLAVLFEQQFVTVSKAVKYQSAGGDRRVRLEMTNASGGQAEFKKLIQIDDKLFESLQPDHINNIYVSLLNAEGAIVSQPYEAKIDELIFGTPVTVDFGMLQDLDAVTVNIIYGNGTTRSLKIYLQKDASENKVLVQSDQFSQEADLGSDAKFDFSLELFSGKDNTFKLEVVNLPLSITRYFTDPATEAKLSQFKFTESARTRRASLKIFLPDRPGDDVQMDQTIPFYVLVVPQEKQNLFEGQKEKIWTQNEIDALGVGCLKMELVVRGNAKLLVNAPKLYYAALSDEVIEAQINVKNEGSRRLDNIKFDMDVPLNWKKQVDPMVISFLNVGEERTVKLQFTSAENVAVGKYEIRVRTSSTSDNQPVNAEDKMITVEIQSGSNVLGTLVVVVLIVGVIGGIVWFGIKLTRK